MGQKRKYCDHRGWQRIVSSSYEQLSVSDREFNGYLTLFVIDAVREPLCVPVCGQTVCIADSGFSWLQQIPLNTDHVVTTMFDANGQVVQWYIDIRSDMGLGEDHVPWFDDLYLDLVVSPNGKFELLDADELQDAFDNGVIDKVLYDRAWQEARHLQTLIEQNQLKLLTLANDHRHRLLRIMGKPGAVSSTSE